MTVTYSVNEQGEQAWMDERAGLLTASRAKAAVATGKTRNDLILKLIDERRTGVIANTFTSDAMRAGIENEAQARAELAFVQGLEIEEVGLATNDRVPNMGASLDGLVRASNEGVEIKCPLGTTILDYHEMGGRNPGWIPPAYRIQILCQMLVCNLDAVHFYAWHPVHKPYYVHVPHDRAETTALYDKLVEFLDEVDIRDSSIPRR